MSREHFEALLPRAIATKGPKPGALWQPIHFTDSIRTARREYERGGCELATMIGPDRTQYLIRFKRRHPAPARSWFFRSENEPQKGSTI